MNNALSNYTILRTSGWYIGEGLLIRNMFGFYRKMTIREQLARYNSSSYTIDELIDLFELSPSRLDREMKYISNERWNASTAIGLANGKLVFAFPWLDDIWKDAIKVRIRHCSRILKQNNCIVIIPTTNLYLIEDIVDEIIYL
ncbi:hypothetical protein D3C73_722790 [compost metagenome]